MDDLGGTTHRMRIVERAAMASHEDRREKAEAKAEQEQRIKEVLTSEVEQPANALGDNGDDYLIPWIRR